jgi:hypothetical protein
MVPPRSQGRAGQKANDGGARKGACRLALLLQLVYAVRLSADPPAAHSTLQLSMTETPTLHEFSVYEIFSEWWQTVAR